MRLRYRIDGVCIERDNLPKRMQNNITSRIKIMSKLDIAEKRKPQDGKFQMKIGHKAVDLRVSILPVVWGEKTVFRILDSSNLALDIKSLGFEPRSMEDYTWACAQPYGMILGHLAKGNPQLTAFDGEQQTLILFRGPHAYVSPAWYATEQAVPEAEQTSRATEQQVVDRRTGEPRGQRGQDGSAGRLAPEGPFQRARLAHLEPGRRAGQRGGRIVGRGLVGIGERAKHLAPLLRREFPERLCMCLFDLVRGRRPQQVAVALDGVRAGGRVVLVVGAHHVLL